MEIGCFRAEMSSGQSIFMPFCCKKLSKVAKLSIFTMVVADRYLLLHILTQIYLWLKSKIKGGVIMDCVCCGRSLAGGVLILPWEDGDNEYAYVTCPHCGEENIQKGYGEDDD